MRAIGLLVVIGLIGCTADTVAEIPVCTCPAAAAAVAGGGAAARIGALPTTGSTAPAVNATNAYNKVERGIAASVTSDNVTANNIKDVTVNVRTNARVMR
jgi:hypothetical protein